MAKRRFWTRTRTRLALVKVIKTGPKIDDKHVNSGGTHSDDSNTLRLDGLKNR